jgi:hypothetical protein
MSQEEETTNMVPDEEAGLTVGDIILVKGGKYNDVQGVLYGFFSDRFLIQTIGNSFSLVHIALDEGQPLEEDGIEEIRILEKALKPGFVCYLDLHPNQIVETFTKEGERGPSFTVKGVDEAKDTAVFIQEETGEEKLIDFGFTGIPRDLNFEVMRVREGPPTEGQTNINGYGIEENLTKVGEVDEDDLAQADGDLETLHFIVGRAIEVPVIEELKKASSADQIFPDNYQRSEMLSELIRLLPETLQKNPVDLKKTRRLVESMLTLRNDVVQYDQTGRPIDIKPTSVSSLLELLVKPDVVLARKVALMSKVIYGDHGDNHAGKIDETGHLYLDFLADVIQKADTLEKEGDVATGQENVNILPRFHQYMQRYSQEIQTPYLIEEGDTQVTHDQDVFRMVVPELEKQALVVLDKVVEEDEKTGRIKPMKQLINIPTTNASFGTARVLKERVARFTTGEQYRVVEPAEAPTTTNLLLFPRTALRDIGPIRSGSVAQDAALGMTRPKLIQEILEEIGPIEDFHPADRILNIGLQGGIIGNVDLEVWLKQFNLPFHGIGDAYRLLHGYGVEHIEWNEKQMGIFQEKILEHLVGLKMFIQKNREENRSKIDNLRFDPNPLLQPEASVTLYSRLESETLLQETLDQCKLAYGDLAKIDYYWFTYFFVQYPDLVLAVLGRQPNLITREANRFKRNQYLSILRNAYKLQALKKEAGGPPIPNTCPHVAYLNACRKKAHQAKDEPGDVIKTKLLIKLLSRFRGKTHDNWVWCRVCNQHLICGHEFLQIQEFARPREQATIQKEIVIKFSGGVFAGKNICRTCGQGITDLDFDTSLEYDDEGRPMMGRAVMEDQDMIQEKRLEDLLSAPAKIIEKPKFKNATQNLIYDTVKTLADNIGISPEVSDYRTIIVEIEAFLSKLPTIEKYKQVQAASTTPMPTYETNYARQLVGAAVAVLLLDIQTHIPDYNTFFTNPYCREGFFGWPLEDTSDKKHGLLGINKVAASINLKESPWNKIGYRSPDVTIRAADLLTISEPIVNEILKKGGIQKQLQDKREYRIKTFGELGNVKHDQIDPTFRPIPYIISKEEAAEETITAAAAVPEKAAVAWIRTAHGLLRKSVSEDEKSTFSTTTCCSSSVKTPGGFWQSEEIKKLLPELPPRQLEDPPFRSRTIEPTFYTTKTEVLTGELDKSEYYKLFIKVCYEGYNKGNPHEFGLTLTCSHCGLHLTQNPNVPIVDPAQEGKNDTERRKFEKEYEEKLKAAQEIIKANLANQIQDFENKFYDLLYAAQQRASVQGDIRKPSHLLEVIFKTEQNAASSSSSSSNPKGDAFLSFLRKIPVYPLPNWEEQLQTLQGALRDIGPNPSLEQLITAMSGMIEKVKKNEIVIANLIGKRAFAVLEKMYSQPPRECGEAIRTFIMVPFMRWKKGITPDNFKIPKLYELEELAQSDILQKGLGLHLTPLANRVEPDEVVEGKLEGSAGSFGDAVEQKVNTFVNELRIVCSRLFPYLRALTTPGGKQLIGYITRIYVVGIVHHLFDQSIQAKRGQITEITQPNMDVLYTALTECLLKFEKGSGIPNEAEIRNYLQLRQEQELQDFIKRQNDMTQEQKQLEKRKKMYGMGDWAIGGSKGIQQYDPETYEFFRQQRARAGIMDYSTGEQAAQPQTGIRVTDEFVNHTDD